MHSQKGNKNSKSTRTPEEYKKLKEMITLPLKIKMFYTLLEKNIEKIIHKGEKPVQISKDFQKKYNSLISTFKHQTESEKMRLLFETLQIVKNKLEIKKASQKEIQKEFKHETSGINQIEQIQTTCRIKESLLGITKWDKKGFRFNRKQMKVRFIGLESKKETAFDLKNYFIRKSAKHSKTLILETVVQEPENKQDEIYFCFEDQALFQQIYEAIFSCVVQLLAKYIMILSASDQDTEESSKIRTNTMNKATMMTSKVLNEYFEEKNKILKKLQNSSYKFQTVQSGIQNTKIGFILRKHKSKVMIDKIFHENSQSLLNKLSVFSRRKNNSLVEFQILEKFSSNIYVAYFKYFFNGEIYEFLTIMEENYKPHEHTLIFKGIDNFINKQFVDFIWINLKEQNKITLMQLLGIVKSQLKKKKIIVDFLLSLVEPIDQSQQIIHPHIEGNVTLHDGEGDQQEEEEEFWTVRSFRDTAQMDDITNAPSLHIIKDHDQYKSLPENKQMKLQNQTIFLESKRMSQMEEKNQMKFLSRNFRFIVDPLPKGEADLIKEHYLFHDWKISKSGGFVCTNQQQINEQKKVFKWILSQLKKNMFKGKSVLNISFPVTIFKDQSHLKSCARNFSYSPIFLQKAVGVSPLERIKQAVLWHISMTNQIISMNKPFNPILGQTYQCIIDGCFYFSQQISHHPPVTSYIFYGRGYRAYGAIEPKIALGLNCCKGWSPQPNFIEFDDGQTLEFTNNKMVINGMLFGQRSFGFQGINYVLDRKNRIGAQINYRAQTSSFFKKNEAKADEVTAEIFRVDKSTVLEPWQKIKREGKENLLVIDGVWHSQIKINGKFLLDFSKFLSHKIEDYPHPIPSDSAFRNDIKELRMGNMENAQIEKDYLEAIQRNDKKLREAYQIGHHLHKQI